MNMQRFGRYLDLVNYVKSLVYFVCQYCKHLHAGKSPSWFVNTCQDIPNSFKPFVIQIVHKTWVDIPLLALSLRYLETPDRKDCLIQAFTNSYSNKFSDDRVIEWAVMLCTLSSILSKNGFEEAVEVAQYIIIILCNEHESMPALAGFRTDRLLFVLDEMMQFSMGIYKNNKGCTSHQFNENDFLLPINLKKFLKDALFQLEFSAMLEEYVSLIDIPNCSEQLAEFMKKSYQLHNNPLMKTKFMEWISFICIISVACYEIGCEEALDIGKRVIEERCRNQESLDEFRNLGCDV